MANKAKSQWKDKIKLTIEAPKYVAYLDTAVKTPVVFRVENGYGESLPVFVTAESDGLLLPYEGEGEAPFESSMELTAENVFSPLFLSENDELKKAKIRASLRVEDTPLLTAETEVTVLPYDWWEGTEGNPERIAAFVRPRLQDCARVLSEAGKYLKKWKTGTEFIGYTNTDKNTVRQIAAAIFAAIKSLFIERDGKTDLTAPLSAAKSNLMKEKKASELEIATFAAACLEAAKLHPVIAVGKNSLAVGLWLYDSCFLDSVTDDSEIVLRYVEEGINNLCFFDAEDLFSEKNTAFTPSEGHFRQKLKAGYYESFVDIGRCRIGGIAPLPLRGKNIHGYELVRDSELSQEEAPAPLPVLKRLRLDGKQPKNKLWERRLLDLTAKNALLNFNPKHAVHVYTAGCDALYGLFLSRGEMRLKAGEALPAFGGSIESGLKELLLLEEKKGLLRTASDPKELADVLHRLQKKNREADEETGAKVLYFAFGFLKYLEKDGARYAPLVLASAVIKRAKGNEEYSVSLGEEEYSINTTLLEYLKQEFNIDVRGLGDSVSALKISEILSMVRAETQNMKGWEVMNDCYLAAFSFQNYLMWNDVHTHIDALKSNKIVGALLTNRYQKEEIESPPEEDEGDPARILLPLSSDSSQYSAVALSEAGASFVLHGPPGTGKSQTITNIIANALYSGKRVLFVAEKKAALDVVKKRLDGIGIGEFCLELHSNKTDKSEILKKLEDVLTLKRKGDLRLTDCAEEIGALREELKNPVKALHKKRRLGVSVYQAMLLYLQNRGAPDVMDIESSFYDSLTEKKLGECRNLILSAASAASECGGVFRSPFEIVGLTEYSTAVRDGLFCASEVMVTEIRHLRSYLDLFLEFYRQRVSTLTVKKLELIKNIALNLASGKYDKYYKGVSEEEFYVFYNANRRLDDCLSYYYNHFKSLISFDKEYAELKKFLETGGDYKLNKAALTVAKRLKRAALHEVDEDDVLKYLETAVEITDAIERIQANTALAKKFSDRSGEINFKKREDFLKALYDLHALAQKAFLDYNPDAFNGMCIRATSGYTKPVLEGLVKAYESFLLAEESFLAAAEADKSKLHGEDVLEYFSSTAGALIDNIDMLPNWCMYKKTAKTLKKAGLSFISDALESGKLKGENILAGFEKNVYKNFLEINIPLDPYLSHMTVGTLEETIEKFRLALEEFARLSREVIREKLVSRLPAEGEEGALSVELSAFTRLAKGKLRGTGLRALFGEIPTLLSRMAPCMLMSPATVAQYIQPEADVFDLVIFDEASQMMTAEAVGSIARAKQAIIVGDPKQLPPTQFFHSAYLDEENLENEDLESILDDCLALGLPERHLVWHYRSKHESLIAFSNSMYYDNKLCTFPSPDALESKVKFCLVDGTYDRGFTKRNRKEAEALVQEVIRRLSDPVLSRSSIGVVTFSGAQQEDVERLLNKAIGAKRLESVAYEREEPLFVKNLENVQGDERDVILFSVCYGPDSTGRVSLNFGPINQAGGWRRLNVAVSRAREEMMVFSTMTSSMIDLSKTTSKGVAGFKAFLEFAEKGRTTLAVKSEQVKGGKGIGKFIAKEIESFGYECRTGVGASAFKIDVAVVDPKNKHKFILGIVCDATDEFSVKDRNVLQIQSLKRANWNVMRINCVSYFNNPKREIKRVKDMLDKLTGADKKAGAWLTKYKKPYKAVKEDGAETAAFITSGEHEEAILAKLKEIVAVEEPISRAFLKKRLLSSFGILKSGSKVDSCLDSLIDRCGFRKERALGSDYYYKTDKAIQIGKFRLENLPALRKTEEDFTPFEVVSLIKGALEDRVALYMDEVNVITCNLLRVVRPSDKFLAFLRDCIMYGEERGIFVRSVSDRISLA